MRAEIGKQPRTGKTSEPYLYVSIFNRDEIINRDEGRNRSRVFEQGIAYVIPYFSPSNKICL